MSERINGVESTATESSRASGAMTSTGSCKVLWGSTPKATATRIRQLISTPATTPRIGKRELSVITGIASHESVGWREPPLSATAPPITRPLAIQAPNIRCSGFATRGMKWSARAKDNPAGIRNSAGHQPSQGLEATSATAKIVKVRCLTGRTRCSMSSIRSRSNSSRQSHDLLPGLVSWE